MEATDDWPGGGLVGVGSKCTGGLVDTGVGYTLIALVAGGGFSLTLGVFFGCG